MFEQIRDLLVEEYDLDANAVKPESSFVNDLKLNSLELADLVVTCEDAFEIEIEEKDIHTLQTIADLMEYIEKQK
ncbi:MAG: acyl carrier protein [Ruminococcaceae bacterium]|nr:acyl carrier protein [Oscillospiraceae bacterium]